MTGETLNVMSPAPHFKEFCLLLLLLTVFFCGREASNMNFGESNFFREASVRKSLGGESSTNSGSLVFRLKRTNHFRVVPTQQLLSTQGLLHTALKRDQTRLKVLNARLKYLTSTGSSQHPLDIKSKIETKSFNTSKLPTAKESLQSPVEVGDGIYYTEVELGTPPKKFTLTVDTGSDLCWVQCEPCTKCYEQKGPKFNPKQSSSYKKLSCSNPLCESVSDKCAADESCLYSYGYGDGSTTKGSLSTETMSLYKADGTTRTIEGFTFGCGNANQGTFDSTEEGTLGLGDGPLSLLSQLGPKYGNKFSYCLVRQAAGDSSKTSPLIIGDGAVPTEPGLQYTTMTTRSSLYFVNLEDVSVGSKRLNLPAGTFNANDKGDSATIFDSGTTFTYFPKTAYDAVEKAFLSSTSLSRVRSGEPDLGLCFQMEASTSLVPGLTFHFKGGASYSMRLENYFVPLGTAASISCLAITSTTDPIYIVGNIQQQDFHILYDRENSTLGFVSTNCSTLG